MPQSLTQCIKNGVEAMKVLPEVKPPASTSATNATVAKDVERSATREIAGKVDILGAERSGQDLRQQLSLGRARVDKDEIKDWSDHVSTAVATEITKSTMEPGSATKPEKERQQLRTSNEEYMLLSLNSWF